MKNFLVVASFLITCLFAGCNTCDGDHCKVNIENVIEIRFNMDSLNGGFTKAQFQNVSINSQICIHSNGTNPYSFYICSGGNTAYTNGYLIITNNNTSTQNKLTNFQYTTDQPKCCEALQNHNITSFLFNGNTVTPTSTPLIVINNN